MSEILIDITMTLHKPLIYEVSRREHMHFVKMNLKMRDEGNGEQNPIASEAPDERTRAARDVAGAATSRLNVYNQRKYAAMKPPDMKHY